MGHDETYTGLLVALEDRVIIERARQLRTRMTPAERKLWTWLRCNRLNGFHFRRQPVIAGFVVDFYCHEAKLAVEVDSPIHDLQSEHDEERTAVLQSLGIRVICFQNAEVMTDTPNVALRLG